ncbi:hypothetical protein [Cysteiniphilum marinum]|uniref:hypothetical protein n=1 Tax=Cysteiniphilum marinum TaxID=2774191 RepID=UPI00193B98DA|nr:hypothetical protein [Cysteiniphilum marinum]
MAKQSPVQRLEAEIAQLEEKRKMINAKIKEKKELLANKKRAVLDKTLGNLSDEQMQFLVELAEKADAEKIKTVRELLD